MTVSLAYAIVVSADVARGLTDGKKRHFPEKGQRLDMLNVLLVEDDLDLAETVVQYLELEGIRCDHGSNGMAGLQLAKAGGYQVLLLDINLPCLDGLSLCKQLRDSGDNTPILMLTSGDGLDDKLAGNQAGTDDFLVKPFALPELVVRLEALARQVRKLSCADLEMNLSDKTVTRDGSISTLFERIVSANKTNPAT